MSPERIDRWPVVQALLVAAGLFLALGLSLPAFELYQLGSGSDSYSVATGIVELARTGSPVLAAIVFAFSVVFPLAKLVLMSLAWASTLSRGVRLRTALWLTLLGRWSMLDVFVVVILIGSVHLGVLSSAEPQIGIYLFGTGILLSMLAAGRIVARLRRGRRGAVRGDVRLPRVDLWAPVAAAVLFGAGISLPLIDVEKWLFWSNQYSVVSAVGALFDEGRSVLGLALLLFVVLLPLVRFVVMAWMRLAGTQSETRVHRLLLVDEWAMLDVYVFALFVVVTKITDVAGVTPRLGLWLLVASAALSLYDSWRVRSILAVRSDATVPWR